MAQGIFSKYSTGENRVTASIVAVLGSLALHRTRRLLGALIQDAEFPFVRLSNQPAGGGAGVPDAEIAASFRFLVETKAVPNALHAKQLQQHLAKLDGRHDSELLLVLTPDVRTPALLGELDDRRVVWSSFDALHQAIEELLIDAQEVVSEREAFLLRELQAMFEVEGLVVSPSGVVVVPARVAWPTYERVPAYICQPGRAFRPVKRIAFYLDGEIMPAVPAVLACFDDVEFTPGRHTGPLGKVVDQVCADPQLTRDFPGPHKVFLLSAVDDPRTLRLVQPIENDLLSANGKPIAFTQGQRYVSEGALLRARRTSELCG